MNNKTERQVSELAGEFLATSEVPVDFAPGFNLEALKEIDPDPVFTTVRIKAGKGDQGSGPFYGPEILQDLERQINTKRPPGYKGHQDSSKVSWEWREPVTAWVGAKFQPEEDALYVKGYVPTTAHELRSQLKLAAAGADVINSVSIFGLRDVNNNTVTTFDLWSLDWTPKGRAGMETALVSVSGEQQSSQEEEPMDRDEIIRNLTIHEIPEDLVGEIRASERTTVEEEFSSFKSVVGEMKVILELDEETDPASVVEAVRTLVESKQADDLEERLDSVIAEQVTAEMVKIAVRDIVANRVGPKSTDEEIAGEVSKALDLPYIAALKDGSTIPSVQGSVENATENRQGTAWA